MNFIRARDIDGGNGVRCRLNVGNIHGLQLFDEADDVVELRAELLLLVGRKRKPREMRDVFDVEISSSHARKLGVRA